VWVMPSGDRTDKEIPVSRDTRMTYIDALIRDIDEHDIPIIVTTIELDGIAPVETFDTVTTLESLYPERKFIWVFGADSTQTMNDWKNGQWLLDNLLMLVVERAGSLISDKVRYAETMSVRTVEVSSTEVRRRIVSGEPIHELVSAAVHQVINQTS
jgi:nicotinate-nucleotide adenylyltransferase